MFISKSKISLLCLFFTALSNGICSSFAEENYNSFNCLLINITEKTPQAQAEGLKAYIEQNPEFYPAYLKLIDFCIFHNKDFSILIEYLDSLKQVPAHHKASLWALGKIYFLRGDLQRAYQLFLKCLDPPNPPQLLFDFVATARSRLSLSEIKRKLHELNLPKKHISLAQTFYHYQNSSYEKVIEQLKALCPEIQDDFCFFILAKSYISTGQYQLSQKIVARKLADADSQRYLQSYARFLLLVGIQEKQTGSFERADSLYDAALTTAQKVADTFAIQYLWGLKGNIAYITTDYAKAMDLYRQAMALAKRCGCFNHLIVWQTAYGKALTQINRYADALEIYDAANQIAQKFNYQKWLARVKLVKADLFSYLHQPKFAMPLYTEVCRIAWNNKFLDMYHLARSNIADTLISRREFRSVRKIFHQAVEHFKSKNNFLDASFYLWKIGETFRKEKNYSAAKKNYRRALNLAKNSGSKHYQTWYLIYLAEAEARLGNFTSALKIFQSALRTAREKSYFNICTQIYQTLGDLYFQKDSLQQAISYYRKAIARIEKKRGGIKLEEFRIGFFSEKQKTYRKLASCYLKLFKETASPFALDSLFYFDQLSRARTLVDLKLNSTIQKKLTNDPDYLRYLEFCSKLRKAQKRIRNLNQNGRNNSKILREEIRKLHAIRYSLLSKRLSYINRVNQQRKISKNLTLSLTDLKHFSAQLSASIIVYHLSEWSDFAIVANSDSVRIVRINENSRRISSLVDSLIKPFHRVKSIEIGFTPFNAEIAHLLYKILFEPIEKKVRLTTQVLIVPDLPITNLPMSMLLTKKTEISTFTPLDKPIYKNFFLLKKYSFGYMPSISLLKSSLEFFTEQPQIAVLANPIANKSPDPEDELIVSENLNWCFHQLNFAEQEAAFIKNISRSAQIFPQEHATKKALYQCAQTSDILHFATHAFVDNDFDLFSGLVLSAGTDTADDGLLMGYELSDLSFKPKLVVLNGCETGKGEQIPGEGTLGLPRLFLIAGCKSVILSLWRVEDKFASQFMPEFYAYFLRKKTTQMEALRQAQLEIIGKNDNGTIYYAHPFFWGSFLCYGQPISMMKTKKNLSYFFTIGAIVLGVLAVAFFSGKIRKNKS